MRSSFEFIKSIGLIFVIFAGLSCQKHTALHSLSWDQNESPVGLQKIVEIETTSDASEIYYKNQKIEFRQQEFNRQPIENTFIKKVYGESRDIKSAQAKYVITSELKDSKLNPVNADGSIMLSKMSRLISPLKIRTYESQSVLKLQNSKLRNLVSFQYEASDGTLWKAYFDKRQEYLFNEKLGSQFSEVQAQVYPQGPRISVLTDVVFRDLQFNPLISNESVSVDSESKTKINSVVPQLKFETNDDRFDQVQVLFYLDHVLSWMKDHLGVTFPNKLQAVVSVGYPDLTNTAFYFQNKIRFGRGDNVDYTMLASDPSIVYHESFHALIDGLAHLPFEGEGGSINEGFADFFTCVVLDRPFLGESAYMKAPYKRTVQSDIKLSDRNSGLYHDSQIISSLMWEIKQKLGSEKALLIATETLVRLNPSSRFDDFNQQILKAVSPGDLVIVSSILKNRGFKYE